MAALFEPLARARRDPAVSDSSSYSLQAWIMAFNILSALGFIMLAVVFFTALLSSNVKRVSTWYLYMLAWMAFCISPFLVIGHQTPLHPPSFVPCVLDSALMYASRPFAALGTLSLILQLYLNVSIRLKRGEIRSGSIFALLVIPPILYLIMFLSTFILGIVNPDKVELEPEGGFYCHLNLPSPAIVGACLVVFATSAALVIEVMIVILLSRNWRAFRALQRRDEHTVSLSIIIRICAFAILPMIALGLSFTTYFPNLLDKIWAPYNLLLASFPTAAALIFGSQSDIVHVWMFWRVEGKTMTQLTLTTVDSNSSSIYSQSKV